LHDRGEQRSGVAGDVVDELHLRIVAEQGSQSGFAIEQR
jgi:hypothetical protein